MAKAITPSKKFVVYDVSPSSLEYLGFNRGKNNEAEQTKKTKVDNIKNLIKEDQFHWAFAVLMGIPSRKKSGKIRILDGHHRTQAVIELIEEGLLPTTFKIPVHVIKDKVITSKSDVEIAELVALINNYDPRWSESEHVETALNFKLKSAQAIKALKINFDELKLTYVETYTKHLRMPYNWAYALATEDGAFAMAHNKVTFGMLKDNSIAAKINTKEFEKTYTAFKRIVKNQIIPWKEKYGIRPSSIVGLIIKYGKLIGGLDKLANALDGRRLPKNCKENDIARFLHDLSAKLV